MLEQLSPSPLKSRIHRQDTKESAEEVKRSSEVRQSVATTNKDKSGSTYLTISPIACITEDESHYQESIFRKLLESQTR